MIIDPPQETATEPGYVRACSCHPDDKPPVPCPGHHALMHCEHAAFKEALVKIAIKASAGLCQFTAQGKHEFLRDISKVCESLGFDVLGDRQ